MVQKTLVPDDSGKGNKLERLCLNIVEEIYKGNEKTDLDGLCRILGDRPRYSPDSEQCREIRQLLLQLRAQGFVSISYGSSTWVSQLEQFKPVERIQLRGKGQRLLRRAYPATYARDKEQDVEVYSLEERKRIAKFAAYYESEGFGRQEAITQAQGHARKLVDERTALEILERSEREISPSPREDPFEAGIREVLQ
jgi:hypothetical protein